MQNNINENGSSNQNLDEGSLTEENKKAEVEFEDEIEVEVSGDKLEAYLRFEPGNSAEKITAADIKAELEKEGIVYGIMENKLEKIAAERKTVKKEPVAEGREPVKGKDGKLIYHFEEKEKQAGKLREDGTIDFHNLDLINNVRRGEKIITKIEPESGEAGINVFGDEIAPPPLKEIKFPGTKNTVKKDNSIYAAKDGQIIRRGKKVEIKEVYTVRGDVDLSTGNINFVGSVKVSGNVKEGFEIRADGDVEIAGNVGAADIKAAGNVLIKKGFLGRNKGKIEADGDFTARFIENGRVSADNVEVYQAIMHSNIRAKNNIVVKGGKGLIVGGRLMAQHLIEADIIGSSLATKTEIIIGLEPELREELQNNSQELNSIDKNLEKIAKSTNILNKIKENGRKLPKDKLELFKKLKTTSARLSERKAELEKENKEIKERLRVSDNSTIKANKAIFPGVQLLSSKDKIIVSNKLGPAAFTEVNKELRQAAD
ncbi:MAG: FapA family protein [Halanaerobiales bacterium]|nr:FapA family protein [Halanaerobiales bacterium]